MLVRRSEVRCDQSGVRCGQVEVKVKGRDRGEEVKGLEDLGGWTVRELERDG